MNTELKYKPDFIFMLGTKQQIMLPLSDNISFAYNGKCIAHCQGYNKSKQDNNDSFFNISKTW